MVLLIILLLLIDFDLHDVNSVNKSSRIKKHYVYLESDKTLDKLVVIQLMKSCSRSTAFTLSGQGSVDMFPRNCAHVMMALAVGIS